MLKKAYYSETYSKPSRTYKIELIAKIVNSWKPLTFIAKISILDLRLGFEYTSAIRIIWNKTKFEYTKEHFISKGLINIYKLYIFSLSNTMHLQIPYIQKQPFLLPLDLFKGFQTTFSASVGSFQRVSNAYLIKSFPETQVWHGLEYET